MINESFLLFPGEYKSRTTRAPFSTTKLLPICNEALESGFPISRMDPKRMLTPLFKFPEAYNSPKCIMDIGLFCKLPLKMSWPAHISVEPV